MGTEENRKNALRFYEAFNRKDMASIRHLIAEDFVDHEVPAELGLPSGWEGVEQYIGMFVTAFPDLSFEVMDMVAEGDIVAARIRGSGTHQGEFLGIPPSGKRFELEFGDFTRFNDEGLAVEHWGFTDNLSLMQQIGAIPADLPGT